MSKIVEVPFKVYVAGRNDAIFVTCAVLSQAATLLPERRRRPLPSCCLRSLLSSSVHQTYARTSCIRRSVNDRLSAWKLALLGPQNEPCGSGQLSSVFLSFLFFFA